ncbi:hypothetical protein QOZ80_6BG0480740 [Eleusine coracana subsp. coracana]|nr:hypothetical protein QOZ80_6BG0480740 [Eleusine coracana subsp. coracana]
MGELVDTAEKIGANAEGSETLYLRLAGLPKVLLNNGNFVLRSPNGAMLWQSFDHPTDTHLPEMKLRVNYGVRPGDRIVSWRSPSDPAPGSFSYGCDPDTFLQTFVWNGSRPLWRSGVWTGYRVYTEYVPNISAIIYISVVDIEDNAYVAFSLSNGGSRTRYVISHTGKMMLQSWNDASRRWDVLSVIPRECNHYGHCGRRGVEKRQVLAGVPEEGSAECAAECRRNCSCVAYAYANLSSSPMGDPTRCLVYMEELIDTEKIGAAAAASETLYLRLAGLPTDFLVGNEKLLIFEYMPNKSLDALLFSRKRKTILDWPTRFNIIKGVAKGILYLHEDSRMRIIHRDLKASNILLDEEMRPKIADFGMARMFNDNQQNANTKRVVRTYGYMAPEYAMRGIFSVKSDVYSFGVLILEIVSGVKISSTDHIMEFENLLAYAWNLWNEGKAKELIDSSIVESCRKDEALLCIHLGLLCVQDNPNDRPLMSSVVFILENGSTTLPVPNKPVYFSHKINEIEQIRGDIQSSENNVTLSALEGRIRLNDKSLMEWSAIQYATVLLLVLLPPPCASEDRLVPGKALSPGSTIVSDDGSFALGFFSPTNSTPGKLYLGIWYNDIPQLTVVWVANRETPATNSTSSMPTLLLSNSSNLVLTNSDGRVLWQSFDAPSSSSAATGLVAVLLNTGNLVIRSPNGTTVWQSFDHPTDTFLPGMKIGIRYKTRTGERRLVSWKGPDDPSLGPFSFGMDPATFLQTMIWNGTLPTVRTPPWTGYMVDTQLQVNTSGILYVAIVSTEEEIYVSYTLSDGSARTRYVLTYAGQFRRESWMSSAWVINGEWPPNNCKRYGYCGPYGYCDNTGAVLTCKCLDSFEPTSLEDWNNGRFSQGCRRKEALRCDDGFLALPLMKPPDKFVLVQNRTHEECAAECTRNCSCVAYAYSNVSASILTPDTTRCLVWAGELIDTEKIGDTPGSDTLYLRVAGLNNAAGTGRRKINALVIVLPIVLTSSTVIITVIFLACFKGNFKWSRGCYQKTKPCNNLYALSQSGYMAPEYAMEGVFSIKSDVYSFGVLLLEVVTGSRRSCINNIMGFLNLVVYAWNMWQEGNVEDLADSSIIDTCLLDEVLLCIHVALLCVQENPDDRPHMPFVVLALENGITTLPNPNHPAYFTQRSNDIEQRRNDIYNSVNNLTHTHIEGR